METLETVNRDGRDRLYPSLTNPNWLVLRRRREFFQEWVKRLGPKALDVLDVGGRIQPYRLLLNGRVRRYIAIDVRQSPLVSMVARAEELPLANAQFDLVICTQVLEYIREPALLVAEVRRVLRKEGCLMLSAPAIFPPDSDHDFWRFMPGSLRWLLSAFDQVEITSEGSSIAGVIRFLCICLANVRPSFVGTLLRITFVPLLNIMALFLELIFDSADDRFAANFSVFAKK